MRKKGQVETLKLVVGLIIVAIVIFMFAVVIGNLTGIFGKKGDIAARQSLEMVGRGMQGLIDNKDASKYSDKILNVNIPNDFALVGFDSVWDDNAPVDRCSILPSKIQKPIECGKMACLCLYKTSDQAHMTNRNLKERIQCYKLNSDKSVTILGPDDSYYNSQNRDIATRHCLSSNCLNQGAQRTIIGDNFRYQFLITYGDCNEEFKLEWTTRNVYLDIKKDTNNIYLFMGTDDIYPDLRKPQVKT